jgi:hypothetical protein
MTVALETALEAVLESAVHKFLPTLVGYLLADNFLK